MQNHRIGICVEYALSSEKKTNSSYSTANDVTSIACITTCITLLSSPGSLTLSVIPLLLNVD